MKVKCVSNNIHKFKGNEIYNELCYRYRLPNGILPISIDEVYTVYGMFQDTNNCNSYLISDDDFEYTKYPVFIESHFFQIVDNFKSKYWESFKKENNSIMNCFREWESIPNYYEHLIDSEKLELEIFEKYKKLMDAEK